MSDYLKELFPSENEIEETYRLSEVVEQREYLIDGILRRWEGNLNPVLSPVYTKQNGALHQTLIGHTPLLTSKEALEALQAAVGAYDLGHGHWQCNQQDYAY